MTKTSLSELLQSKAEEARKNKDVIDEWVDALEKLFAQLQSWLDVADPKKVLIVNKVMRDVSEPNLGRYSAPYLNINAFGQWVGVIPKARKTIKTARPPQSGAPERATGRVDITDEIRRYVLYRFSNDDGHSWFIEGPSQDIVPLTQERFEEALMSYLL